MVKRAFDLFVVVVACPLWLPVMAVVAVLVRVKLGSPIFFRQRRPGLNKKIFEMIKFRTMTNARDAAGRLLPDGDRLTPFGKWLRSTSLDELPELFNILKRDMSLVGPRPLLVEYLERYTPRQARRHEVRPGITGLTQVKGRNGLSWDQKFEWDVRYVETQNFWLDLKILALTVKTVFAREGITAAGDATMPEFRGSRAERS
jgi:sugar transferase EpsL